MNTATTETSEARVGFAAVSAAIVAVLARTVPNSSARTAALSKVRWVLRREQPREYGNYITIDEALNVCFVDDVEFAKVYTGLDGEGLTTKFLSAITRCALVPELVNEFTPLLQHLRIA